MSGIEMIALERARQIESEGYTAAHDDAHSGGELAMAACAYASPLDIDGDESMWTLAVIDQEGVTEPVYPFGNCPQSLFPVGRAYIGATARIRQLVIAGALIVAEIDRLKRAQA
jgi:hypothetical protein